MKITMTRWLWAMMIPHLVLILLQGCDASLIWNQLTDSNKHAWILLFVPYFALVVWDICLLRGILRKKFNLGYEGLSFLTHVVSAILILFNQNFSDGLPRWIYSSQDTFHYHFTFLMPGLVMWVYTLAEQRKKSNKTRNWKLALSFLVGVPLFWFALMNILRSLPRMFHLNLEYLIIILAIATPILMIYGLFTLIMLIIDRQEKISLSQRILMPIITLVLPLAGLWLNQKQVFPVDLQSPWVYAWVVANSLTLLPIQHRGYQMWSYPIGLISFSVTTYFFLVFLPYLPLFIIAIIIMGLGFLLLSPLALWAYQQNDLAEKKKLWDQWLGQRWSSVVSISLVAVLPMITVIHSVVLRQNLRSALTQVFEPWNPNSEPLSVSEQTRAAESLILLQELKHGVHYPYLYLLQRGIIFGGMVLSDAKCELAYQTLTGKELPPVIAKNTFTGRDRRIQNTRNRGRAVKPSYEAKLSSFDLEHQQDGSEEKEFTYKGIVENTGKTDHCEWYAKVTVPQGLLLTGVELKINETWADAEIRDKKTAIWIFDKIQEIRRDPILVYYESDQQLKVRIYPIPTHEKREFKLTFTAPTGFDINASVHDQHIDFTHINSEPSIWAGDHVVIIASAHQQKRIEQEKSPYVHFIIADRPRDTSEVALVQFKDKISARMQNVAQQFQWTDATLSIANSTLDRVIQQPQPIHELIVSDEFKSLSIQSNAVALGHCIQQALFEHRPQDISEWELRRPEYIVIISDTDQISVPTELYPWNKFSPDFQGFSIAQQRELRHYTFADTKFQLEEPVALLPCQWYRNGTSFFAVPMGKTGVFPLSTNVLETFQDSKWKSCTTQPLSQTLNDDHALWLESFHPWKQRSATELLNDAKGRQLLIHQTAFIAVETQTQKNMLMRKEKQALLQHDALDFEEVKASSPDDFIWMMIIFIFYWIYRRKNRRAMLDSSTRA